MESDTVIGILGLLVTVFFGLHMALWRTVQSLQASLQEHKLLVATDYVTTPRLNSEIKALKATMQRVEDALLKLLESKQ